MDFFSFCLSQQIFISPQPLKDIFTEYRRDGGFFFKLLKLLLYYDLACMIPEQEAYCNSPAYFSVGNMSFIFVRLQYFL